MAILPRFYTVFVSHFSSTSLLIPRSYYEHLPSQLPKRATLMGTGGKFWSVAMIRRRDQVYFDQGWGKFVVDNDLKDGECLTFVYDGDRTFEVTIYNHRSCKETRGADEVEVINDETESESSDDTSLDFTAILGEETGGVTANGNDSDSSSLDITAILGESIIDETANGNDSGCSSFGITSILGEESLDEDSDNTASSVEQVENRPSSSNIKRIKKKPIENPERYLDDPSNACYQTWLKNRPYALDISVKFVEKNGLKFGSSIEFIDKHGKLTAKIADWAGQSSPRVHINKWKSVCTRNEVKKEDIILCEFLCTSDKVVHAIKIHIVRGAAVPVTKNT